MAGRPTVLVANYRVVTPLYMAGSDQGRAEWRVASYAHVLRWWWRALALGRFDGDVVRTKHWEALLFGSQHEGYGASRVRFRDLTDPRAIAWGPWTGSGIDYLKGQGFGDRKTCCERRLAIEMRLVDRGATNGALKKKDSRCHPASIADTDEDWSISKKTLRDAASLMGLLGGLGSRSRRGLGSLSLTSLVLDGVETNGPTSLNEFEAGLDAVLGSSTTWRAPDGSLNIPFSALHAGCTIAIVGWGDDAQRLLNQVGWAFQYYRTWGRKDNAGYFHQLTPGEIRLEGDGSKSFYPFAADHDWWTTAKDDLTAVTGHPVRAVFGMPHNYGQGERQIVVAPADDDRKRRTSPLLIHIQALGSQYAAVVTLLPSRLLPDGLEMAITKKGGTTKTVPTSVTEAEWELAADFVPFATAFINEVQRTDGDLKTNIDALGAKTMAAITAAAKPGWLHRPTGGAGP